MNITLSRSLQSIPAYAFAEMDRKVKKLRSEGVDVIDLGVGDPVRPPCASAMAACREGIEEHATGGYPPYAGTADLRNAACEYMNKRFDVSCNTDSEILVTAGSKEAVFHFPLGLVNPGETVLAPSPGYVPYYRGAHFAGARCLCFELRAEEGFLPDPARIADLMDRCNASGSRVKILWLCYPNAPTGGVATREFYDAIVEITRSRDVVLASDEAYADFVWNAEPVSALQSGKEGVISFFSLSKRSNMTGYRVGWVAGDPGLVSALGQVKVNLDSGTPWMVQNAAAAALKDERHVDEMRAEYSRNMKTLCEALEHVGLTGARPKGAIYVWQRGPEGMTSAELCERLLAPDVAVAALPGEALAPALEDGRSPGEGFVRFSMTALPERVEEAARRIRRHLKLADG